jgi:hypothetical protein
MFWPAEPPLEVQIDCSPCPHLEGELEEGRDYFHHPKALPENRADSEDLGLE